MNSPFVHEASDGFARRVLSVSGDDHAKMRWAFETAHGRIPEDAVVHDAVAFVAAYREKLASSEVTGERDIAAWSALARVLLTSNAFLYVD
jgi:hypothetical protein